MCLKSALRMYAAAGLLCGSAVVAQTPGSNALFDVDGVGGPDLLRRVVRIERGASVTSWIELWSSGGNSLEWLRASDNQDDLFGFSATAAGDVNLDGIPDIVAGAPFSSLGGVHSGAAFVLSGLDGSTIRTFPGAAAGRLSGISVAGIGDVNGDGVPDIAASGSTLESTGRRGRVTVYSGANGSVIADYVAPQVGDEFGRTIKAVPDMTGDGKPDLAILSRHSKNGLVYRTRISVVNPGGTTPIVRHAYVGGDRLCVIDVQPVTGDSNKLDVITQRNTTGGREYITTRVTFIGVGVSESMAAQTVPQTPEDVNGDSQVDSQDVAIVTDSVGTEIPAPTLVNPDVNGDGLVTTADVQAVVAAAASTVTPVTALSAFALNELARMDERLPSMFRTVGVVLTEEEAAIVVAEEVCESSNDTTPCGAGQRKDCNDACCGPGTWKFVDGGGPGQPNTTGDAATKTSTPTRQGGTAAVSDTLPHTSGSNVYATSGTASASWTSNKDATWSNPETTACARRLSLVATGSGAEAVTVNVEAVLGLSATASASGAGNCQSLGDASADMSMNAMSISASVESINNVVSAKFEGNFGVSTNFDSASVKGSYSASQVATVSGAGGTKSGTASYVVKTGRKYENQCTAETFSKIFSGSVSVAGSGTSSGDFNNYYVTYTANSTMNLDIIGGP